MRLEGYFKEGALEAAYITAVLAIPSLKITQKVEFLIDTGATKTTILDKDAISAGIPYNRLIRHRHPLLGLGGLVATYIAKNAEIYFRVDDDSEHKEFLSELLVVKHAKVDHNIMRIPSVLGRDILNKYRLTYDKQGDLVTITGEP